VCANILPKELPFSHFPTPRRLTDWLSAFYHHTLSLSFQRAAEISISDEVFYYCLNKQIFPRRRKCSEEGGKDALSAAHTAVDHKIILCVRGEEIRRRLIRHWRAPDFFTLCKKLLRRAATSADGITPSLLIAWIINEIAPWRRN
jgi:hypothetical protein